jgi:hypothetical protein
MDRKPKATGDPKPPRRKMTPQEQHALFVKTARELGGDEVGEEFERAFDNLVPRKNLPCKTPEADTTIGKKKGN